jgi:hypothetical protein
MCGPLFASFGLLSVGACLGFVTAVLFAAGAQPAVEFAASLSLVPRQDSTGGKTRLGGITKRGITVICAGC